MELLPLWIALAVVIVIVAVIALVWISQRRRLVRLGDNADRAWGEVRGGIERRAELVPRLLEAVRTPASHENRAFEQAETAIADSLSAASPADASAVENRVQGAIRGLFSVAEGYPALQTDADFLALQKQLVDEENAIQSARRFYNGAARELGTAVRTFPSNVVARSMGEHEREFFEVADRAAIAEPPRVQF
ncbi:LemA family protein [Pseudoclavibacter chungangensis]|uniref:LemA family protein n=1 Tax=Pseudoclavibacter chungangensis TaxID=587635 RepID=A0A7J5BVP9_9MICO|nr:LemA family protein [Pseudoclavibacter chungangensis]KAB1657933.1 LemA family protein [Pseudoclavibacter chungangensis]NYJ65917.1 LemA protein [Pseudoclavibacter chungangensis]